MKHHFLLLFLLSSLTLTASNYRAMYFVYLHDKADSPYSLSSPDAFLSQRAIDRRTRFSIPIDSADIPVNTSYVNQITATGASLFHTSRWMNGVMVYASNAELQSILALSFVDSAEMIRPAVAPYSVRARKPKKYKKQTSVQVSQNTQICVDSLHNAGFKGKNVLIAVLDCGYPAVESLAGFDSLRSRGGILSTYNFVDDTTFVYNRYEHGTDCLSDMAFNLPNEFVGTAPDAEYLLYTTENTDEEYLYESDLMTCAFEAADSAGADLITSSLGYFETDNDDPQFTYANMNGHHFRSSRAATMAAERGIIVCIAAGNNGNSSWHYIDTPSDADSIICVGGVDENGDHSYFSSYGPSADGRVKPEICARGTNAIIANVNPDYSNIRYANGTSFATPIAAGAIASLLSALPDVNPAIIRRAVLQTASQATNPDSTLGYGILNVWRAYQSLIHKPTNVDDAQIDSDIRACIDDNLLLIDNYNGPISLYDAAGRCLLSDTYISPVSLPTLSSGIYFLHLSGITLKLIH